MTTSKPALVAFAVLMVIQPVASEAVERAAISKGRFTPSVHSAVPVVRPSHRGRSPPTMPAPPPPAPVAQGSPVPVPLSPHSGGSPPTMPVPPPPAPVAQGSPAPLPQSPPRVAQSIPPRGDIRTPALLLQNGGNQPISVLLVTKKNGADAICAKETVQSARVVRLPICDGQLRILMHNGRQTIAYDVVPGSIYSIYWNGQVWDLRNSTDRE